MSADALFGSELLLRGPNFEPAQGKRCQAAKGPDIISTPVGGTSPKHAVSICPGYAPILTRLIGVVHFHSVTSDRMHVDRKRVELSCCTRSCKQLRNKSSSLGGYRATANGICACQIFHSGQYMISRGFANASAPEPQMFSQVIPSAAHDASYEIPRPSDQEIPPVAILRGTRADLRHEAPRLKMLPSEPRFIASRVMMRAIPIHLDRARSL